MRRRILAALAALVFVAALGAVPSRQLETRAQSGFIPLIDVCDICWQQAHEVYYTWMAICQSRSGWTFYECQYDAQTAEMFYVATQCHYDCWC